jgi:hypothetical protein
MIVGRKTLAARLKHGLFIGLKYCHVLILLQVFYAQQS